MHQRTGGQLVADALVAHGVNTVFGVPGESYLEVLDALVDTDINYVICRQEGGAAYMADAWGKLTGEVGVCMVTRGPGATNASVGIHAARQNSTPMLVLVGQVATHEQGREAFQEIDYRRMFAGVAKWATEVRSADDMAETMRDALRGAVSGRPGPVVVALPEDVLTAATAHIDVEPRPIERACPDGDELDSIVAELAGAARPLIIAGGGRWTDQARADLARFASNNDIPVVAAFRFNDVIDNHCPAYVGEAGVAMPPAIQATIRDADLIVGLGIRFGEMTTGAWSLITAPDTAQRIVHVHPERTQLSRVVHADVGILGDPSETIAALAALTVPGPAQRSHWRAERRAAYDEAAVAPTQPGPLDMSAVMAWLQNHLPADTVITNGAGNFTVWPNKYFRYGPSARMLAPQNGTMGYGLPAAVAAKVADPSRTVVCFAGDGDFQMTMQELGTAQQADAMPIVIVIDNAMYGTIRMHQERTFPGRISGTEIVNPDFVQLGRAYGMHTARVETTAEFGPAFEAALDSPTGSILHLVVRNDMLTPGQSIDQARGS